MRPSRKGPSRASRSSGREHGCRGRPGWARWWGGRRGRLALASLLAVLASALAILAVEADTCLLGVCVSTSGTPSASVSPTPLASAVSGVTSPISSAVSSVASQSGGLLSPLLGTVSNPPGLSNPSGPAGPAGSGGGGAGAGGAGSGSGAPAAVASSSGVAEGGGMPRVGGGADDPAAAAALSLSSPPAMLGLGPVPEGLGGLIDLWPLFLGLDVAGLLLLGLLVRRSRRLDA